MAPSQSTLHDLGNDKKSPAKTVPLPLVPIDHKAPACNECQEFTLKLDPTNANSPSTSSRCATSRELRMHASILAWQDDINHVIAGLGVNQPTPMYVLYTQCMHGIAKSTFEMAVHLLQHCLQS
jgi:hypothetical protein